MEIKYTTINSVFPEVLQLKNDFLNNEVFLIQSPFCNCQSASIGNAKELLKLGVSVEYIESIFQLLYNHWSKHQVIVDMRSEDSEEFFKKIEPLCKNVISTPYRSTNHSDMVLSIIQFNVSNFE